MADYFVQYEYAESDGSIENIELKPGYVGETVESSGVRTSFYVKYSVIDDPTSSWNYIWYVYDRIEFGVAVRQSGLIVVYCQGIYKQISGAQKGDIVEIAVFSKLGVMQYRISRNGVVVTTGSSQFYVHEENSLLYALYSFPGVNVNRTQEDPVFFPQTSSLKYRLYRLCFFDQTSGGDSVDIASDATIFFDLVPGKLFSSGRSVLFDWVSRKSYLTRDFIAGGDVVDDSEKRKNNLDVNNIYVGNLDSPVFSFANDDLASINMSMSVDPIGNELKIDTLEFDVFLDDSNRILRNLSYATPIWYYINLDFVGKFFLKVVERIGGEIYSIQAVSAIGLLEYEKNYGGFYQNKNAKDAILEAITSNGIQRPDQGYDYYSYAKRATSTQPPRADNIALRENYIGTNKSDSGTGMAIYIKFKSTTVDSQYMWMNRIYYSGVSENNYLYYGVRCYYNSVKVSCAWARTINDWPETFTFSTGSSVLNEVAIYPVRGVAYYRTSVSEEVHEVSFTPLRQVNEVFPFYSLNGIDMGGVTQAFSPPKYYQLWRMCFFKDDINVRAGILPDDSVEKYLDLHTVKDATNHTYLHDKVNDVYYPTNLEVGGPIIESDMTELGRFAKSINWQEGVENLVLNGWVRPGTKREVLHQILFSLNLNLYKSPKGDPYIGVLPSSSDGEILENEIYDSGSVEESKEVKAIMLTEHSYGIPYEGAKEVFNNVGTNAPDGSYVAEFNNAPIYGVPEAEGLTVLNYNANAAIVEGTGSISAQVYNHSTRIVAENVGTRPDGKIVSVSDATLVTFLNSANIIKKLRALYASGTYKIKNSIISGGRMLGRKYTLLTPFNEEAEAHLTSVNATVSGVIKYDCEFIAGYIPVSAGNEYNNLAILTGSGTWNVPNGIERIHVVLIGGGSGGDSGCAGEDAETNWEWATTRRAKGGEPGQNGSGGKVYSVDITSLSSTYSYSCGTGGVGGAICYDCEVHNSGGVGTNTTFGSYSSSSGTASDSGYMDIIMGRVYASKLKLTLPKGGDGGYIEISNYSGESPSPSDLSWVDASTETVVDPISTFLTYRGGKYDLPYDRPYSVLSYDQSKVYSVASMGGGAALSRNGWDGYSVEIPDSGHRYISTGGNGANADYVPPKANEYNKNYYGYGGFGGAGGGGGGTGGYSPSWNPQPSVGGSGGYGGRGGDGGDGCVLVYY